MNESDVEYLVVGGHAVAYYGYVRATGDLHVWIAVSGENAERLRRALRRFGCGESEVAAEPFLQPDRIFRMGVPPIRIEILTGISGVEFADCYRRRVAVTLDGVAVSLISLEDLKANKQASGRTKDLADLEHLP